MGTDQWAFAKRDIQPLRSISVAHAQRGAELWRLVVFGRMVRAPFAKAFSSDACTVAKQGIATYPITSAGHTAGLARNFVGHAGPITCTAVAKAK
jgi:hypothetical protein